jgi:GTP cyclohydrolase I
MYKNKSIDYLTISNLTVAFSSMDRRVDFYSGINGEVAAANGDGHIGNGKGHNGAVYLRDHAKRETVDAGDRLLTHVNSEELLRELFRRIGEDPDREGLQQSPARIVRSWNELFSGYGQRAEDVLATQFHAEQYDEMVLLRNVEFYSTCEHHMLPFSGQAHMAYIPNHKIVGLSKLARLLDVFARRLQVQERLTRQVATELARVLQPKGVAVMVEGKHQCMTCRGVRKQEGNMVTSCLLDEFKESSARRTEFFSLVRQ